jgi:four helix bundle protein
MARPKSNRDLIVWQKAMILARQAYTLNKALPKSEACGLLTQIRPAAVSPPSTIAEGHGRLTDLPFRHFRGNAKGSRYDMQTQLELACDLGYIDREPVQELIAQGVKIGRLIAGLVSALGRSKSIERKDG